MQKAWSVSPVTLMRILLLMLSSASLMIALIDPALAEPDAPGVTLTDVSHALEGRMLIITGWVHNRGPLPIGQLVVDVAGFAPSGDLVAFGSDGIPWDILPGSAERFDIHLSIHDHLIREYTVQVARAQLTPRPLAGIRRGVDLTLYRSLVLTMVRVRADVRPWRLSVRSDARGLPVAQVTVIATLLFPRQQFHELSTITIDVPADGETIVPLGFKEVFLLGVRVIDVILSASWAE